MERQEYRVDYVTPEGKTEGFLCMADSIEEAENELRSFLEVEGITDYKIESTYRA